MLVKEAIPAVEKYAEVAAIAADKSNKEVIFKNCAPPTYRR